ncbi:MAG: DUF2905 domain-containing protein [Chloroflexota bacterium]
MWKDMGKLLIVAGGFLIITGVLLVLLPKIPLLGKLPGDMSFRWGDFRFFFPLVTCLILSVALTIILNIVLRFFR